MVKVTKDRHTKWLLWGTCLVVWPLQQLEKSSWNAIIQVGDNTCIIPAKFHKNPWGGNDEQTDFVLL